MDIRLLLYISFLILVSGLGLYLLIKSEITSNKKRTFVRRTPKEGAVQELFFQGYSWIYDSSTSKAIPGVLVYYYENNRPIRIAITEEYFISKYISLLDKEKEDDNRS